MVSLLSMVWRRPGFLLRASAVLLVLVVVTTRLSEIVQRYMDTRDLLVRSLAFGLLPPLLWAIALALAVWKRRSLLRWRFWNRWLAALLASAVAWGVLSYFSSYEGILGRVSLGGWIGQEVRGPSEVLGGLRLLGMTLFVAVVAFPGRSLRLSKRALRRAGRAGEAMIRLAMRSRLPRPGFKMPRMRMLAMHTRRREGEGTRRPQERKREEHPRSSITVQRAPAPTVGGRPLGIVRTQSPRVPGEPEGQALPREKTPPPPSGPSPAARPQPEPERRAARETTGEWPLPPLSLLAEPFRDSQEPVIDVEETARLIERTLGEYGIEVKVAEVKPGPVVTMFGLVPGWNRRSRDVKEKSAEGKPTVRRVEDKTRVKVDSIVAREKDLALALAAPSLRIEAPIPGASLVGIEVPNLKPAVVTLRSVMETGAFQALRSRSRLALALGGGNGEEVAVADLARMPHLLIAGATGSGKSVCINSIIACLIMQGSPWETRLLLIDPKRVELTPFNGIPHLLTPVVVEVEMAVQVLKGTILEMQRRYLRMEEASARNIEGFNRGLPPEERMPFLVVCVDELADLMMSAPYDIEHSIIRLAQLGRATGIHLVVATQRPSVDVVTGLIKANFPSRIGFAVASQVDSRTILDAVGAEKLLGRGDMLFQPQDAPKPKRAQGAFISDREISDLVGYWRRQHGPPPPEISLQMEEVMSAGEGLQAGDTGDELLQKAYDLATQYNRLSTSLLQRRLRIGYPRAARLMDLLEEEGVVGPGEPGKSREVLAAGDRKRPQRR